MPKGTLVTIQIPMPLTVDQTTASSRGEPECLTSLENQLVALIAMRGEPVLQVVATFLNFCVLHSNLHHQHSALLNKYLHRTFWASFWLLWDLKLRSPM